METFEDSLLTKENGHHEKGRGLGEGQKRRPAPDLPGRQEGVKSHFLTASGFQ